MKMFSKVLGSWEFWVMVGLFALGYGLMSKIESLATNKDTLLPIFTEKTIILSNNSNKFCKLIHFSLSEIRLLSYELSVVGNTVVEILTDDIDSFSFRIEILK